MKLYVIRQKSTGLFIPNHTSLHGKKQTGGSQVEPAEADKARIFPSRNSAVHFLRQWLKGVHQYKTDYFGEIDFKIVPVASRHAEDMEILEYDIQLNVYPSRRV